MSTASSIINMNIEIISVLCQGRAGVTFNGILAALQRRYPLSNWTQSQLQLLLNKGIKQGIFIPVGTNPAGPVLGYAIQPNMLRLNNPRNFIYEPFCSQIRPIGCCDPQSVAVGAGTF
jgi:hypothetical protein